MPAWLPTWLLLTALALSAPTPAAALQAAPPAVTASPEAQPEIPPPSQVMSIPPELRARLQADVLAGEPSPAQRLSRLGNLLLDPERGLGITYREDATYSVAQAYVRREANCLTFTMLFLALAREAGLDAYPQEIRETLSWRQDEGILYRNNHINALVRLGGRSLVVDLAADSVIARQPPLPVSDRRLISHYYNNLAIQRLSEGGMDAALALIATALELDPDYPPHWSNAGVIHMRTGDATTAERDYRRALSLDPSDAGALFNMAGLAHRNGDRRAEADYRQRLDRVQRKDPFHHVMQAMEYERAGDYAHAIEHYRRAIQLHPGEHRFYYALARAYLRSGDTRQAAKALVRAQSLSDGATRAAYQAQLQRLKQTSY
jgi:Flp pilus assembly protein TadD